MILDVPKKSPPDGSANVPMRGIEPTGMAVREEVSLVAGRMFEFGTNEVIVGRARQRAVRQHECRRHNRVRTEHDGRSSAYSKRMAEWPKPRSGADARTLQGAYRRGNTFQSVLVQLDSTDSFDTFRDWLTSNPQVNVAIRRENEYYAAQSRGDDAADSDDWLRHCGPHGRRRGVRRHPDDVHGGGDTRARNCDTARAWLQHDARCWSRCWSSRSGSASSVASIGGVAAYLAFNGYQTSTMNFQTFTQVAFAFRVTPELLGMGLFYALLMGLVGGLLPAIRAARLPIASALREL